MKVTFLGTGTSQGVPVIGCKCAVCTSKDYRDNRLRTSVLINTDDKNIVIDSGPDFRYQMLRAKVDNLDAILFTHEHKDHIAGLDDIRPYNYLLHKKIDIYATPRVQEALKREFYYIFADTKYHGLPQINLFTIDGEPFEIGESSVIPFEVMHHKLPITCYRIGNFAYITDAKTLSEETIAKIKGVKYLVLNALQKESHISHLTLKEALDLSKVIGAEHTYLTHISHNLGLHTEVEDELPENIYLAYDGLALEI